MVRKKKDVKVPLTSLVPYIPGALYDQTNKNKRYLNRSYIIT